MSSTLGKSTDWICKEFIELGRFPSIRHGGHIAADPSEETYEHALQTKLSSCLTCLACLQSGTVGFQQREENLQTVFCLSFVDANRKGSLLLLKLLVLISLLLGVASL